MINTPSKLEAIAEKIKRIENNRERLAAFLKEIKYNVDISGGDVVEKRLCYPVKSCEEKFKVCATDGGVSQNSYHGLDIILVRAVSVIAEYKGSRLENIAYFPSAFPEAEIEIISDPFTDEEFVLKSSLLRMKKELSTTLLAIKKFSPHIVLLDGSIVPHPSSRPQKNSPIKSTYQEVLGLFKELYESSFILAGCCEDSRGRKFCEIISEKILSTIDSPLIPELKKILANTRDTTLLFNVLDAGERTCVFKYGETPVTKDLGEHGNNIYTFYIKTAQFDRPVRVDFYAKEKPERLAEKIASILLSLACNSAYGFPAPLIEADLRAKLKESDAEIVHKYLVEKIGLVPSLFKLRREMRPFG